MALLLVPCDDVECRWSKERAVPEEPPTVLPARSSPGSVPSDGIGPERPADPAYPLNGGTTVIELILRGEIPALFMAADGFRISTGNLSVSTPVDEVAAKTGPAPTELTPQCADGADNDADGAIDLDDPHWESGSDDREAPGQHGR